MTPTEECDVHFTECIQSFNSAWRILKELDSVAAGAVKAAAYRMALVEYAKPYKRSFGTRKSGKDGYVLPAPSLFPTDLALHKQILDLRDQVLAHSDLTLKDAKVYVSRSYGQPLIAISSKNLPSFPATSEVIGLIERSLDLMYAERERIEEAIAPDS